MSTWRWPLMVGGLLSVSVGFNMALLVKARGDTSFAVEPSYYRRAVEWDRQRSEEAAAEKLGWRLDVDVARGLGVEIRDPHGEAVTGAKVSVSALHNTRANAPVEAQLFEVEPGRYRADVALDRWGLWEIRITAERGVDLVRSSVRREVPR